MPRLKNRSPRMCRDRSQAYVTIGRRRIPLGRWGTPEAQEAYDRTIAEWLSNGRRLPASTAQEQPEEATVTAILLPYWRHAKERYDARTLAHIKPALKLVRRLYGSEPAVSFGPKRLRVVRDRMANPDKGKPLARKTVNDRIAWIKAGFKWAASHELCDERIYRRLTTVANLRRGEGGRETEKIRPVPRAHVRRVRPHLTRPVRGLVALQLLTGARPGELVNLRAVDIDTGGDVWTFTPADHKTAHHGHERTIYFGPRAQRVLRLFLLGRRLDAPLFSPRDAEAERRASQAAKGQHRRPNQKPNAKQTQRRLRDAYDVASYRRSIAYACDKAGVVKWSPHKLRHNAATQLRRQFGLDVASVILGHSSLAITQTYAELNHKKAVEVIAKVG